MRQWAGGPEFAVAPVGVGQAVVLHFEWGHAGHRLNLVLLLRWCNCRNCTQPVLQKQGRMGLLTGLVPLAAGGRLRVRFVSLRSALTEIFLFNRDHDKIIDKHSTSNKNKYRKIYQQSLVSHSLPSIPNSSHSAYDPFRPEWTRL